MFDPVGKNKENPNQIDSIRESVRTPNFSIGLKMNHQQSNVLSVRSYGNDFKAETTQFSEQPKSAELKKYHE
jgi:hypothetical protein